MVLNQYGDHDPTAMMYVLENRIADVRAQEATGEVSPGLGNDAIQALVLRANVGDCLVLNFTNRLDNGNPSSLHVYGRSRKQPQQFRRSWGDHHLQAPDP